MASIWKDTSTAMNNEIFTNSYEIFKFMWDFITFSGETQDQAEVRFRKMG
jgi:hypothetical protein